MQKEEKGESSESCGSLQAQVCRRNQEEGRRSIRIQRKTDRCKRSREGLPPDYTKTMSLLDSQRRCEGLIKIASLYEFRVLQRGEKEEPVDPLSRIVRATVASRGDCPLAACFLRPREVHTDATHRKRKEKEKEKRQAIDRSMGPAPKPSLNGTQSGEAHSKKINPKFTVLPCAVI